MCWAVQSYEPKAFLIFSATLLRSLSSLLLKYQLVYQEAKAAGDGDWRQTTGPLTADEVESEQLSEDV